MSDCGSCGVDLVQVSRDPELVERSTRLLIQAASPVQKQLLHDTFSGEPPEVLCATCFIRVFSEVNIAAHARIYSPNGIEQPVGDIDTHEAA